VLVVSADNNLLVYGHLLVLVHLIEVLYGLLGHHHTLVNHNIVQALMLVSVLAHVLWLLYLVVGIRVAVILPLMLGHHTVYRHHGHRWLRHYVILNWLPSIIELVKNLVSLDLNSVLGWFGAQLFLTVSE